jgi:two-component system, NarL family, sensor kinase
MARQRNRRDDGGRWMVAWQVGQFTLAGLIAVAIVGVATAVASQRVGKREAIVDARTQTVAKAQGFIEPAVTNALKTGDPAAVAQIDKVVQRDLLDASLVRVKIWTKNGTIVYSDEPRLIGSRYTLGPDERAALDNGLIEAEVSDLAKPENRFERSQHKLLEVYLPIRTPDGERLLFEAYFRYDAVVESGSDIWRSFAPITIGALIALELVQIPLAYSLARRLRQRQIEREDLLRGALDASNVERRRIASDLHDGVVQDLAGVAFALGGSARRSDLPPDSAELLDHSAAEVRESIKALRSLLVEIYPPNLDDEGLEVALTDLLARANGRGITTTLDAARLQQPLSSDVSGLLYRVAQEALRNVLTHGRASSVVMTVATDAGSAVLDVTDDGIGFDPEAAAATVESGHFGLRALADRVSDAGGRLQVESAPGAGTHIHAEVPLT